MLQRNTERFGQVLKGKLLLFLVKIVGYIWNSLGELAMKVSDILRVKGNILITVRPDETLATAVQVMSEKDLGSLVVMDRGNLVGMLTFREVMKSLAENNGSIGAVLVGSAMDKEPLTCTSETDMDEVRRMMLTNHARYMPVIENRVLMGVISFYDVAKAVVDSQNFENKMLKAYIRDWPDGDNKQEKEAPSL
jgi:CBS domain-containing protein